MARELRVRGDDMQLAREQMAAMRSALGGDDHRLTWAACSTRRPAIGLDWDAPIQSVDISALQQYGDEDRRDGPDLCLVLGAVGDRPARRAPVDRRARRAVAADASGGAAMVRKIDADLRLSRATGTIQVLATHRLSDFERSARPAARPWPSPRT